MEITRDYYSWAQEMIHTGRFPSERDKTIWAYHAEGLSCREIMKFIDLGSMTIHRSITTTRKTLLKGMVIFEREEVYTIEQRS